MIDEKNRTIVDIWNEVKEEEKTEVEALEYLAAQVDIDSFHQKIRGIERNEASTDRKYKKERNGFTRRQNRHY